MCPLVWLGCGLHTIRSDWHSTTAGVDSRIKPAGMPRSRGIPVVSSIALTVLLHHRRAEQALRRMKELSPQSSINGDSNAWIIKPAGKSRGRGIQVVRSLLQALAFVTDSRSHNQVERYIVQKYVENPMLVDGRKFDVRQWILVTDLNPLTGKPCSLLTWMR